MDQTRTGALIRTLRQQKHLTQRQLADTIGVSDKAVSKWERGCGAPDISLLPRLSQALGTSAEALPEVTEAEVSHTAGTAVVTLSAPVDDAVLKRTVEAKDYTVTGIA